MGLNRRDCRLRMLLHFGCGCNGHELLLRLEHLRGGLNLGCGRNGCELLLWSVGLRGGLGLRHFRLESLDSCGLRGDRLRHV